MLAIQTLTEFSLRYANCKREDSISVSTIFDSMEDEKTFLVSFQFRMAVNTAYDSSKIKKLFCSSKLNGTNSNDDFNAFFLQRSISFSDYLDEFGIGLLLLPILANLLDGRVKAKLVTARRERMGPGSDTTSAISSRSYITANTVGEGMQSQSLVVSLQVPLNKPDNNQVEEHKMPFIVPAEQSNRC